jgi:aquaporin Z
MTPIKGSFLMSAFLVLPQSNSLRLRLKALGETMANHLPEYCIEASLLCCFMISAGLFGTLLEYPKSSVYQAIPNVFHRRILMGLAMGVTAVLLIYSPWGKRSGAHFNPAATLTFWRLGKVKRIDAICYLVFQFIGGAIGTTLVGGLLGEAFL